MIKTELIGSKMYLHKNIRVLSFNRINENAAVTIVKS